MASRQLFPQIATFAGFSNLAPTSSINKIYKRLLRKRQCLHLDSEHLELAKELLWISVLFLSHFLSGNVNGQHDVVGATEFAFSYLVSVFLIVTVVSEKNGQMKYSMDGNFEHLNTLGEKSHIQSSSLDYKIKDECRLTGTADPMPLLRTRPIWIYS